MKSVWQVRWHAHAADCSPLLWQQGFPAPLEGRWWYEALEAGGLSDQFRFLYAEVYDAEQRAVALAPAFVMDIPLDMFVPEPLVPLIRPMGRLFPFLLHQRTLFFGSPCSDCGWIGFDPGCGPEARAGILAALDLAAAREARRIGAPMRVWKDFPEALRPALDRLADRRHLFRVTSFPGTAVALPAGGREAYFMAMKPSRRQQLRRKLRRSQACVPLTTRVLQQPSAEVLAGLFALFWQTYERAKTRFERLTPAVFERLAQAEEVQFIVLETLESAQPVAFMLVYVHGPVLVNKFIGIDYGRPREWLLYFRLWEAALDLALSRGCTAIESGQTGYRAKIAVGHSLLPLWNWCVHRNPLLHWIYAAVGRRVSWASLDEELALQADDPGEDPQIHGNP